MIEKSAKRQKKATISEQDVASLLLRYTPKTVLAVLHEVSQCTDAKRIDWNALVQKTSTGICCAREYQMLWRHLAYRDTLLDKLDDDAQPLDDDSDLEFELEAFPSVSNEASVEASACVKVLIASAKPSDSNPNGSIVEAPLTINIPNSQSPCDLEQPSCSMQGTNVVVPVFVQKQPAPAATITDGLDKRKRKLWSEAEDLELIAAVQKCGEGNWSNILRGDFKGDRTASQLSQRWSIIRKKNKNVNLGNHSSGPQLSESQLATRHAVNLALDMPPKSLTSNTIGQGGVATYKSTGTNSKNNSTRANIVNSSQPSPLAGETLTGGGNPAQLQKLSQETYTSKPSPTGSLGPTEKPRASVKKTMLKPTPTPNSSDAMVRATAVAAGARIASPSDAESLLKAAQSKNAIHIMPSGGGSIKSSMGGGVPSLSENLPNVHYIRTGLARTPISNYAAPTPSIPCPGPAKAVPPPVKPLSTANGTSSDVPTKQNDDVSLTLTRELPQMKEVKSTEVASVSESGSTAAKEQSQGNGTRVLENSCKELVQEDKAASSAPAAMLKGTSGTTNPVSSLNSKTAESNGISQMENPVGSSTLKTADSTGVSGAKNSASPSNLKIPDAKRTPASENPVNLSNSNIAELKGTNGVQSPVSLSALKTDETKGTNVASNPVILSTSKPAEVKGMNGSSNSVSLSTSKTAENNKQFMVNTLPKKAGDSGNGNKGSGSLAQACENIDAKVEQIDTDKMEQDCRNAVTGVEKNGEHRKMEVDVPSVVTAVEKNGENHSTKKQEDLPSIAPDMEKNGVTQI